MKFSRIWAPLGICALAVVTAAEDPQPVSIDELDINQEEMAVQSLHFAPAQPAVEIKTELRAEIERIFQAERDLLAPLYAKLKTADRDAVFEIERSIAGIKQGTEIELLRAQQRYAEANGQAERADEIASAIEAILHPQPVLLKIERPTPDAQR